MPTLNSAWVWVDMSPQLSAADTDCSVCRPVPVEGTIKTVRVMQKTLAESGTFVLSKKADNILSAASVDLTADITAATPKDLTLTTNKAILAVKTTDYIDAVFALTTCALASAISVLVAIEPGKDW